MYSSWQWPPTPEGMSSPFRLPPIHARLVLSTIIGICVKVLFKRNEKGTLEYYGKNVCCGTFSLLQNLTFAKVAKTAPFF